MAQLQKGFEYDSSNPAKNIVTDDNLNALVANATLLSGAITEQTANSVTADTDIMVLSKAGSLIKQTKGQFTDTINSNIVNVNTVNSALVDTDDIDTVDATLTGNLAVGGNSAMTGNLAVIGNSAMTGNLAVAGTANFTGALQVKGTNTIQLYDVSNTSLTLTGFGWGAATVFSSQWYLTTGYDCLVDTITVPAGERWVVRYDSIVYIDSNNPWSLVWMVNGVSIPFFHGTVSSSNPVLFTAGTNPSRYTFGSNNAVAILNAGTNTVKLKGAGYGGGGSIVFTQTGNSKTVYKYKIT